jgi:hypothetical protein
MTRIGIEEAIPGVKYRNHVGNEEWLTSCPPDGSYAHPVGGRRVQVGEAATGTGAVHVT